MTAVNLNRAVRGPVTAVPVVAGKGVRLVADTVNNRFVVEADETVLWEDSDGVGVTSCTLSESMANFESIKILYNPWSDNTCAHYFEFDYNKRNSTMDYGIFSDISVYTETTLRMFFVSFAFTDTTLSVTHINYCDGSFSAQQLDKNRVKMYKVVGVNRIAST